LRTGDSVSSLIGALGFGFGNYRLQPTAEVNFVRENDRPVGPPDVGGSLLTVAGFNVLNYFTTLDDSGPICGPDGDQGCRGADNAVEFDRQKAKLVAALTTLDADVVGLIELENAADDTPIADLVEGLNAVAGAGTYAYIPTSAIGTDAIRQGLVYKPSTVTPVGGFEVLDSSIDPDFLDQLNRPVLAQTFEENISGERFTVAVNHLKSKGSDCNDEGDPDTGDGQGNCNLTRTDGAQALVDWLATDPTGSGDPDFLIVGDLNAYAMEDPVMVIEGGGYVDLIKDFVGAGFADGAYSFNFQGQSGYLDHALSSAAMTPQVSGTTHWHINSDEPRGLDYNDFNQPGLFNPDEFRASDHDAIVVSLLPDEDGDGVWDGIDECPGTVIPESVPARELGTNRFALVDDDRIFDTKSSRGRGPRVTFNIFETAGCSCEQIIDKQELGNGHTKYGCSLGEMEEWLDWVSQP
jgi:predicted extracellular nuclease